MPQDASSAPTPERPRARPAIDSSLDRTAAFGDARRHTLLVKSLRLILPLCAVMIFASYGLFMQRSISIAWGDKKVEVGGISISSQALVAYNPRYTGFDKQGGEFEVRAATAEQDLKQKGLVRLNAITGTMFDASRSRTDMKAIRGNLDTNTNVLEMFERIDVDSQNGMTAVLTSATVYTKESRIVSNEPVVVTMPSGVVQGKAMTIEQKRRQVLFTGGVVAELKPQPKVTAGQAADVGLKGAKQQGGFGASDAPIHVTSSRLLIDDNAKLATFIGNVVARQNDAVLETPELEAAYEGQPTGQPQSKQVSPAAAGDPAGRLRRLVAKSDVVLTRGIERATGSSGEFDAVTDRAVLLGPVAITAGPDRGASSDRADIDNKSDTILLTGNVVVTQQKNVLKGRVLLVDRKKGTMQMSAPAQGWQAKGQISARLYQAESDSAAAKKNAQTVAAKAPAPGPAAGTVRTDPSQPIDIESDTLDVDDRAKTAVFRGKVRAVQGDYTIHTEELVATYTGESGLALSAAPAVAQPAAQSGQPKGTAQLQKVTSPRHAEIIAKDGRKARGNTAEFDTKANTAILIGDVQLTQGTTITTGPRALLDMNSGSMRILDSSGFSAESTPAQARPPTSGRAQLLLYPHQVREEQKDKAAPSVTSGRAAAEAAPAAEQPAPKRAPPRTEIRDNSAPNPFGIGN